MPPPTSPPDPKDLTLADFLLQSFEYLHITPKWIQGHQRLREHPTEWFRDGRPIDDRDMALINAEPMPWVDIGEQSFLKHMWHKIKDQPFVRTMWTVKNDTYCRSMIAQAGSGFVGFAKPPAVLPAPDWEHMMLNVHISGDIAPGCTWGLLSGRPTNVRVLAGHCDTCPTHPWDIMILRDFHTNLDTMDAIKSIASRKYDILLMKMCEDFDHPWVVLAVKDAGVHENHPHISDGTCCLGI